MSKFITAVKGRWQPKRWEAKYDIVILMEVAGVPQRRIAEEVGMTLAWVNNIINCDEGRKRYGEISLARKEKVESGLVADLDEIRKLAVGHIKETLQDEDRRKDSPIAIMDRCITLIRALGIGASDKRGFIINPEHSPDGGNVGIQSNGPTIIFNSTESRDFFEAMSRADKVQERFLQGQQQRRIASG